MFVQVADQDGSFSRFEKSNLPLGVDLCYQIGEIVGGPVCNVALLAILAAVFYAVLRLPA